MFKDEGLYFVPLGGSNEIGMNLNLYRYKGQWLMVDLGIGFADDYMPGVDVIVPNIDFIAELADDLAGLVLTHAHEDHIGAVPYLWQQLGCPVYATPFTANVLQAKLDDDRDSLGVPITRVKPGSTFTVGPFVLEMVPLTHSIPEMNALAIHTDKGTVLHTGDWKLDADPVVGVTSDEKALKALGKKGVLAMVCDSTNVFEEGESGSESGVRDALVDAIAGCENRVVVTTFASNVARLSSIIHAAHTNGRQVALAGRSLHRMTNAARDCGYIDEGIQFLTDAQAMDQPKDKVLLLTTGCQGEPRAALWRMASGDHPNVRLSQGDTVIFSSREIPGNEKRIGIMCNNLVKNGVRIITPNDVPIHVSGHPCRDELSRMYQMVKPKIAVPVHGEQRHMREHANFAKALQVPHTVVGYNGAVIRLDDPVPSVVSEVPSGYMCVDGTSIIPADGSIMRMRRKIKDEGVAFITVLMDDRNQVIDVRVSAPGLLDAQEDDDLLDMLSNRVSERIEVLGAKGSSRAREDAARSAARKLFKNELGKRPVIQVHMLHA